MESRAEYVPRIFKSIHPLCKKIRPIGLSISRQQVEGSAKLHRKLWTNEKESPMNIRNLLRTTFGALLLIGCFLSVEQSVSAEPADNCMKLKGNFTDENAGPGQTAGQITKAGILNGSTQRVFNSGALPTPDPTTVSFTGDYTVTTNRGVLKTHDVYIFDFATGLA